MKNRKWFWIVGILVVILVVVVCSIDAKVSLDAPQDFEYEYTAENHSVHFAWDEVENATGYQIDYGNGKSIVDLGEETMRTLANPEAGQTFTARIRAVCKRKDKTYYSEWESLEYTVPLVLGSPSDLTFNLNGRTLEISWSAAEGADSYEVTDSYEATLNGQATSISANSAKKGVVEGENGSIYVRAVRTIGSEVYCSDWVSGEYSVPTVDLSKVHYSNVFLLDSARVKEWADYKGFSCEVSEEIIGDKTYVVLDVTQKDELNSGFFKTTGRVILGAAEGFIGGYAEETYESYSSDFATIEDSIMTILSNDSVKDYAESVDESATYSGAAAALLGGFDALFLDTKIHYKFYYADENRAAEMCITKMLKNNRENYEKEQYGEFEVHEDGKYHLYSNAIQQNYCLEVHDVRKGDYEYWMMISSKEIKGQ